MEFKSYEFFAFTLLRNSYDETGHEQKNQNINHSHHPAPSADAEFLASTQAHGWLFSPETVSEEKSELIVFLKPHVIGPEDQVPSADTPGLRPDSLTKPDVEERLKRGEFGVMSKETTYFEVEEREAREKAAKRAEEDARKKKESAP